MPRELATEEVEALRRVAEAVGKPLLCAALTGGIVFALRGQELWILLAVAAIAYAVLLLALGVISRDELRLMLEISGQLRQRVVALKR